MKKIILLLMLLLFVQIAYADRVMIVNLHYEKGKLSVVDKVEKFGYYPDRKIQPDSGHRAEIVSADDAVLYDFVFDVPLEHFTDIQMDASEIQGGLVRVDSIDFALILPSLPDAKQINFYNEKQEKILTVDLLERTPLIKNPVFIGSMIFIVILLLIFLRRKKYSPAKVI
jgi:hypothetical protein